MPVCIASTQRQKPRGTAANVLKSSPVAALLLWLPAGLVGLALVAFAAVPALLGSDYGRQSAIGLLNSALPVHVAADSVQLSWGGPISVDGLRLAAKATPEQPSLSAKRLVNDGGILSLLLGRQSKVTVTGLSIDGMLDDSGDFRVLKLLPSERKVQRKRRPLPSSSSLRRSVRVSFTADVKLPAFNVAVVDSSVLLPDPYREIAGGPIHVGAALGAQQVSPAGWGAEAPDAAAERCTLEVRSPNAQLDAAGWRLPDGTWRLREPAAASTTYSPALAEYGLSLLNPLLGDAVALQQGGRAQFSIAPQGLAWPATTTTVRTAPLQLAVGRSPLLRKLLSTLAIANSSIGNIDDADIWTAPLEAEIDDAGPVRTRRSDLLLRPQNGQGGVHLILWGSIDSSVDGPVDVTLGLPADLLGRLGLEIPADQVLPIHIGGTSDALQVDWTTASSKLATLLARQRAGGSDAPADLTSVGGFAKEVFKRALKEADKAQVITEPAPPLREKLPWAD